MWTKRPRRRQTPNVTVRRCIDGGEGERGREVDARVSLPARAKARVARRSAMTILSACSAFRWSRCPLRLRWSLVQIQRAQPADPFQCNNEPPGVRRCAHSLSRVVGLTSTRDSYCRLHCCLRPRRVLVRSLESRWLGRERRASGPHWEQRGRTGQPRAQVMPQQTGHHLHRWGGTSLLTSARPPCAHCRQSDRPHLRMRA
jgi:hypothetical protein